MSAYAIAMMVTAVAMVEIVIVVIATVEEGIAVKTINDGQRTYSAFLPGNNFKELAKIPMAKYPFIHLLLCLFVFCLSCIFPLRFLLYTECILAVLTIIMDRM